nr:hypothetical protein [uncultured Solibaculum sp.]
MQLCNEVCAGKVFESALSGAWVNVSASALVPSALSRSGFDAR